MTKKSILLLVVLLLCCTSIYSQYEQERITRFHSDIVIDTTGKIQVTEHITVFANGYEIKRGIVRQIPIYRTDQEGKKIKIGAKILFVTCNGQKVKYKTNIVNDNMDIYIGEENIFLKPGIYEYALTYENYGQIGFFDRYDELYWNVTGNFWNFKIEKASASILLPEGAFSLKTACYTGSFGAEEQECSSEEKDDEVLFSSNRELDDHEGFSIAVSFPPGIIKRPPPPSGWEKNKQIIFAAICLLIISCYYLLTWEKVGKDPEKPVVIPAFKPPHEWSPAVVRYLYKKTIDNKIFTAALVGMAVKKSILIQYKSKVYSIKSTGDTEELINEEKEIYDIFFPEGKNTLDVSNKNQHKFIKASSALSKTLKKNWKTNDFFRENVVYAIVGAAITIALMFLYLKFTCPEYTLVSTIAGLQTTVIGAIIITVAIKKISIRFFLFFIGLLFLIPSLIMNSALFLENSWITFFFMLLMLLGISLYVYLIKAPTGLGAQIAAELEGFRLYLKTAEEDRLNMLTPPEKTPELFEELLPYAIALDVENDWSKKFDSVLKQLDYHPEWYSGNTSFISSGFTHSFSSSVNSVQAYSSSGGSNSSWGSGGSWSSGSSGGGFSGGGGGGGGGRGW